MNLLILVYIFLSSDNLLLFSVLKHINIHIQFSRTILIEFMWCVFQNLYHYVSDERNKVPTIYHCDFLVTTTVTVKWR